MTPDTTSLFLDASASLRRLTHRLLTTAEESNIHPKDFIAAIVPVYISQVIQIILNTTDIDKDRFLALTDDIWEATVVDLERREKK
jgi:hypothetical protein